MICPCHARAALSDPLQIWLIGDGKPGHENQSAGLTDAIARRTPCEVHRISLAGVRGIFARIRTAGRAAASLPRPDLIVAAGHATHGALLWLARKNRARSILLMRPSLPMAWFDLCIVPGHDFPAGCDRENVIFTRGALNRVAAPEERPRDGKMILIGGPSASHGWNSPQLLAALAEISSSGGWELTDSRRTPEEFLGEIPPGIRIFPHRETTPAWLPAKLAAAAEVWVTEDSVSMVYEALSSGARVGLLPVPRLGGSSRVLRGMDDLVAAGFLTTFADWRKSRRLAAPPEVLREADRCAEELLRRFGKT